MHARHALAAALLGAVGAMSLVACAGPGDDGDAEGARRAAEDFLHRVGAHDVQGVCDLGLSRDGRTPLKKNEAEMRECVALFTSIRDGDTTGVYAPLKNAKVRKVTLDGDHASVAKADTENAELVVRNDSSLALLRVDGTWYVGSDDAGASSATAPGTGAATASGATP